MRVIHPGYGWRPNTRIHKRLMNMSPKERGEYELKLKKRMKKDIKTLNIGKKYTWKYYQNIK